jgi:biopolymer transport protein TolR
MAMGVAAGMGTKAQINITPMIDILLVLIIIFMMLTPNQRGEQAEVPQLAKDTKPPGPDTVVVIQVLPSSGNLPPRVKINQQEVNWDQLGAKLNEIFKQRGDKTAFVQGDQGLEFQYVADVIDTAHNSGVEHIGLMTAVPARPISAVAP